MQFSLKGVSLLGYMGCPLNIICLVGRGPRVQTIHIPVEHAKGRSDQNRIVSHGRSLLLSWPFRCAHRLHARLSERLRQSSGAPSYFLRDRRRQKILFNPINEVTIAFQVMLCNPTVCILAKNSRSSRIPPYVISSLSPRGFSPREDFSKTHPGVWRCPDEWKEGPLSPVTLLE